MLNSFYIQKTTVCSLYLLLTASLSVFAQKPHKTDIITKATDEFPEANVVETSDGGNSYVPYKGSPVGKKRIRGLADEQKLKLGNPLKLSSLKWGCKNGDRKKYQCTPSVFKSGKWSKLSNSYVYACNVKEALFAAVRYYEEADLSNRSAYGTPELDSFSEFGNGKKLEVENFLYTKNFDLNCTNEKDKDETSALSTTDNSPNFEEFICTVTPKAIEDSKNVVRYRVYARNAEAAILDVMTESAGNLEATKKSVTFGVEVPMTSSEILARHANEVSKNEEIECQKILF